MSIFDDMRNLASIFLSCVLLNTHGLNAQQYETRQLLSKGHWQVSLTHNTQQGNLWCDASTVNNRNQRFGITAYDQGELALFIFDQGWSLRKRSVRFLIDIDYNRWTIDGIADGIGVSLVFVDVDKATRFLKQLMRGNAVAVYNDTERRIATFSLSGSSAAISTLMDCWNRIAIASDPFTDNTDPF